MSDAIEQTKPRPARRQDTKGLWAWAIAFAVVLIPVLGGMLGGIGQWVAYRGYYARHQNLGAINARNAANWGLTYAIIAPVSYLVFLFAGTFSHLAPVPLFIVGGLFLMLGLVATLLTIIYAIIGTIQAARGRSFDPALGFRFFKGQRSWVPAELGASDVF